MREIHADDIETSYGGTRGSATDPKWENMRICFTRSEHRDLLSRICLWPYLHHSVSTIVAWEAEAVVPLPIVPMMEVRR